MQNRQRIIAILSFSPIHRDARVLRQIEYLSQHFIVQAIGYGLPVPGHSMACIPSPGQDQVAWHRRLRTLVLLPLGRLAPRCYQAWYWGRPNHQQALERLRESGAHIIHANDWDSLPVAVRAAEELNAQVVLDLHEYAPLEAEDRWHWRVFVRPMIEYFLNRYAGRAVAHVTINQTIAERYAQEYGFRPLVVMNAPRCTQPPAFRPTSPNLVRLVHHGGAKRDRRLELMIQVVALANARYTLDMVLMESDHGYIDELMALAQQLAPGRISFPPPVSPGKMIPFLGQYDMGIHLLPFTNFNNYASLPNKFFDFMTAGLAVCVGPSPEMAHLTQEFGFGVVAESFNPQEAAAILNSLSAADIDEMKLKALETRKDLNADVEMGKLVNLYEALSPAPSRTAAANARGRQ